MPKKKKLAKEVYVVNHPQPGQSAGDWLVRLHGKFISTHRKKSNAIKRARAEAKKRGYSVLIQNKDGKWAKGFTPVPK